MRYSMCQLKYLIKSPKSFMESMMHEMLITSTECLFDLSPSIANLINLILNKRFKEFFSSSA